MFLTEFPSRDAFTSLGERADVIPLCREILADMETPVSLLTRFYTPDAPLFLLESVEGGERWGRFSFLGVSARMEVRVFHEHVETTAGETVTKTAHHGAPLTVLRELMAGLKAAELPELPRFQGGLTGFMTYEMVSFFENIPHDHPKDKPLAHFILADEMILFDNIRNTMVAMVLCFKEDSPDMGALYESGKKRLDALMDKVEHGNGKNPGKKPEAPLVPLPVISDEDFRAKVAKTREAIFEGEIIQAVISQPFTCKAPPCPVELYRAQRYVNPSPYLYFMNLGGTCLVGSSPEVMVRLEQGTATVRPIAGTRPRGTTQQEDRRLADDLLKDEKERAEHLMLVDLGRNDLGRVATTGTVQVTDLMVVERYSHVMHLVSNICCDLKPGLDAFDLVEATFPAGTLSGAPKVRAMEIIAELEESPRGPYGGAVGYVSFSGNMDLAITIRTAVIEGDTLTVRAGAGIVADSDPETERQETVNKAMAIEKALMLATRG
ncbi:anthranilate synthase component I family protein [Desulfoluna spongiiphila]|uniref:Anthranilate synthase component 1 n=1 Tax=Desulfoluna spongiiphila TaxID=419481 RepID=A0A1G5ESL1_9BACT|nr:anthranilate synthase component I family protein [Desulfoluna spongiiphila]SCY29771.1 anthranilate synthase, component I [Desulfoluna spongiiphila]